MFLPHHEQTLQLIFSATFTALLPQILTRDQILINPLLKIVPDKCIISSWLKELQCQAVLGNYLGLKLCISLKMMKIWFIIFIFPRSVGHSQYGGWRKFKGHLKEGGWNLVAFVLGLLLATLYGVTALFLQKQPLWFCVYTTLAVAFLAAFGMGLSARVRADVAVMLPSLCSGQALCVQICPQVQCENSYKLLGLRNDQQVKQKSKLCQQSS